MIGRAAYRLSAMLLALGIAATLASAQSTVPERYQITRWGMEQGLPQSSVNDIIQTRDGYIWLATFGGLVRFDGVSFRTYDRFNTPCIRSDRILRLHEDLSGTLWATTEDGLLQFNGTGCRLHLIQDFAKSPSHLVVREDRDGKLWALANAIPYLFNGETFVPVAVETDAELAESAIRNGKGVWLAYSGYLLHTIGSRVVRVHDLTRWVDDNIIDAVEFPAESGTVYVGTSGTGIFRYQNGKVEPVAITNREHSRFIWKLQVDANHQLWALNYYGLHRFESGRFRLYEPLNPQVDVFIVSVLEDKEGNMWLGTANQGLLQLRESIVTMIDGANGVSVEQMLSLTKTADGEFLFATNCGGVFVWRSGVARAATVNRFLPNQCVWSVFKDSKGRYWFGSRELYMTTSLDKPGELYRPQSGFPFTDVHAITEDREGRLWFGSHYGVVVADGPGYRTITVADGLSHNDTRAFYQDRAGRMWVGTIAGLNVVDGDRVRQVPLTIGAGTEHEPYIRAIHEDAFGVMWFGTYGNGMYRWENGHITNIRREHGLFDNIVSHLIEDSTGHFWSGSNQGIFRTSRAMLDEFSRGRIRRVKSDVFGIRDGMNSAETNGGFQPNVIWDNGLLYVPTVAGVAVVATKSATSHDRLPPVYITGIRTATKEMEGVADVRLNYGNSFLEIDYTALHYRDATRLRFRYRLNGLSEDWIEAGNRRSALFASLPPGSYTFELAASVDGVAWTETPAQLAIDVVPPFWQTAWFRVLAAAFFLVSGPVVYVRRVAKLQAEQERQRRFTEQLMESQENERRRIAAELHDGLGQQILVIKNRAELAQRMMSAPEHAVCQLEEIVSSASSAITDVRNITHDLRPVHLERFGLTEALTAMCKDIQQTSSLDIQFQIDNIDDHIPAERQIHFYRVVQEGIANILKHARAENVSFIVKTSQAGIRAQLWDDGIGFDIGKRQASQGLGLSGMQERMQSLGGSVIFESDPSQGTTLTLTIPASTHA